MMFSRLFHHIDFLKGMINAMFIMLGIFGLSSHYYSYKRDRYCFSRVMLVYAVLVGITFSLVYLKQFYDDDILNQFDMSDVTKLYSYMNIVTSIASYITGLRLKTRMPIFMNGVHVSERVDFFGLTKAMVNRPITLVGLRAMLMPVMIELVLVWNQMRVEPDRSLWWTVYALLPIVVAQVIPNCVFGALELSRLYIVALNTYLRDMQKEIDHMQTAAELQAQKPYYRMKRFCELADRLDALAEKYADISHETVEYMNMYGVPFVLALVCNLCSIVVGVYMQYDAIADTLVDGEQFDVSKCMSNVMFLLISVSEIVFLARGSSDNVITIHETGVILQNFTLKHADVRFKQSLEEFTLIAYTNQFKIKPLGLLEINMRLLPDASAAATSFLLILIQSDLALRFALK